MFLSGQLKCLRNVRGHCCGLISCKEEAHVNKLTLKIDKDGKCTTEPMVRWALDHIEPYARMIREDNDQTAEVVVEWNLDKVPTYLNSVGIIREHLWPTVAILIQVAAELRKEECEVEQAWRALGITPENLRDALIKAIRANYEAVVLRPCCAKLHILNLPARPLGLDADSRMLWESIAAMCDDVLRGTSPSAQAARCTGGWCFHVATVTKSRATAKVEAKLVGRFEALFQEVWPEVARQMCPEAMEHARRQITVLATRYQELGLGLPGWTDGLLPAPAAVSPDDDVDGGHDDHGDGIAPANGQTAAPETPAPAETPEAAPTA